MVARKNHGPIGRKRGLEIIKEWWIQAVQQLLITQTNHWMIYLGALTFLGLIIHSSPDRTLDGLTLWKWVVCSIVPFVYWLIRCYTERFRVLMGSHLLIAAACVWGMRGEILETAFLFLLMFRYIYASFDVRVETDDRMDRQIQPGAAGLVTGIGGIAQYFLGVREWMPAYAVILVLYIAFYFLQLYLERYRLFLKINARERGRVPARKILLHGLAGILLFVGIMGIGGALLGGASWLNVPGEKLWSMLLSGVSSLMLWLAGGSGENSTAPQLQSGVSTPWLPDIGRDSPFYVWVVLERLVPVLFGGLLALILLAALISYVRYVTERFRRPFQRTEEQIADEVVDIRMKCTTQAEPRRVRELLKRFSAAERIRRIYRKEVWTRRGELGTGSRLRVLTARECGARLARETLAHVYEKARYSDQECTGEDVRRARNEKYTVY